MRNEKIITAAIVLLFGLFFFAREARAQTIGGYTSIDWDAATNTVDAYSETDEDYEVQSAYGAYVSLTVRDQNGNLMGWDTASDDGTYGYAVVEVQFSGTPNTTYFAWGLHKAYAEQYDYNYDYNQVYGTIFYYDYYYFSSFESQGIIEPYYFAFLGPGPTVTRPSPQIILGGTNDEASVTTGANEIALKDVTVYERAATFNTFRIANLSLYGSSHYSDTCGSNASNPFEVRVHFLLPPDGTLAHERCTADGYGELPGWNVINVTCTMEKGHVGRLVFNAYPGLHYQDNPKITLVVGGDSPGGRIDRNGTINLTCSQ